MSEEKEYPSYNINVGVPTEIESLIKIKTYKYHPYGLEGFRKSVIENVDEWQSRGLSWNGHDNLTHAWRTPWDIHIRYEELMSPIVETAINIARNHSPRTSWYVKNCWISEYVQNSGANKHDHGQDSLGWSFCYYVQVPDTGPGFTLCDDVVNEMYQLNITNGDLLIFRHPLQHQVFPSLGRRIIISGNIQCSGDFEDILQNQIHRNENFLNEIHHFADQNNEIDIDNWDEDVLAQKFLKKVDRGY